MWVDRLQVANAEELSPYDPDCLNVTSNSIETFLSPQDTTQQERAAVWKLWVVAARSPTQMFISCLRLVTSHRLPKVFAVIPYTAERSCIQLFIYLNYSVLWSWSYSPKFGISFCFALVIKSNCLWSFPLSELKSNWSVSMVSLQQVLPYGRIREEIDNVFAFEPGWYFLYGDETDCMMCYMCV